MPYRFSPTTLSLLDDCPKCFWIQFKLNIKRPEGIFPSLPNGMDRILKTHFDAFAQIGKLPPELATLTGYKLFEDKETLDKWRDYLRGIRWIDNEGNTIMGAVDNILVKGEKLVVLDYKTRGHPIKENTADYYKNQMDIYNFLLRKNGHETEEYSYLLFYHPNKVMENGEIIFHSDLVKIKVDVQNAEKIITRAIELLKKGIPESSQNCEYCKWQNVKIKEQKSITDF